MRTSLAGILVLLLAGPASGESGVLMRAVSDEMDRTIRRLRMNDLSRPYFVSYLVEDTHRQEIESTFGAVKDPNGRRYRNMRIDLRVGSRKFDNTHYASRDYWNIMPLTRSLVRDDDYDALRYDIWLLTDKAYKRALERFSQKRAYKQNKMIKEEIPDLTKDPVQSFESSASKPDFNRQDWERRLRKLSALFKKYPEIQSSKVTLYWTDRDLYFADSEGRRTLRSENDYELFILGKTQAPDGMRLFHQKRFIRQRADRLPPFSLLEAEVVKLADELTALVKAPKFDEDYIGPMMFEGQAAGEFFNQLLAHNISFPRETWVEDERVRKKFANGGLTGRLGLRVISPFLSVEDDPGLREFEGIPLIGHYAVDHQGIPAERIELIEKGILKDIPTSRSPTKKSRRSNGHGRGATWEAPSAHISNMIVWSEKTESMGSLKANLIRRAKDFGLDHAYIVRQLYLEEDKKVEELLSDPLLLFRVDVKNGKETLVRNAKFSSVTLRALRDIVAVSHRRHVYNFYKLGPLQFAKGQTQASIVHPSILIAEMELKRTDKKPEKLPYLKHPHFN